MNSLDDDRVSDGGDTNLNYRVNKLFRGQRIVHTKQGYS
jgi:hypothetical protein